MRINYGHPLTYGLVAAYPFYEGSGLSLNDVTGFQNTGTLTGGPTWGGSPHGSALNFVVGSSQYVNCGNNPAIQLTGDMSICALVMVNNQPSSIGRQIVAKDKDTGGRAYTFDYNEAGSGTFLRFYINGGGGSNIVTYSVTLTSGVWYHVAATYNTSGTLTIYINGVQVGQQTGANSSIPTATANLTIGAREYSGFQGYWDGGIAGVTIYNRTLTAAEVLLASIDPFAIYRQPDQPWYFPAPSGATVSPLFHGINF